MCCSLFVGRTELYLHVVFHLYNRAVYHDVRDEDYNVKGLVEVEDNIKLEHDI